MNVGKSIQQSIDVYLKNFGILISACLITGLVSVFSVRILAGPLVGGVLILGLKILRGEPGKLTEIFAHFDQLVPTLVATLILWGVGLIFWIIGIIPVIGMVISFVATPVLSLLYFLVIGFIVDQKMRPLEAVKRSCDYFAAEPLQLWLYSLAMMILGGIGAIIFLVGVFLTMPLGMMGMIIDYQRLSTKETPLFEPGKQTLRIAGTALAVLFITGVICWALGIERISYPAFLFQSAR